MLPFSPPDTEERAADAVSSLTDAGWVLAALVDVAARLGPDGVDATDPAAGVLAAAGLFVPDGDRLVPAAGVVPLLADGAPRIHGARSVLGQLATVARGGSLETTWTAQDDETLIAQGTASGRLGSAMVPLLLEVLPGLRERLQAPGAAFLDVGSGIGAISCALAEALPAVSVVGVDPFERVVAIARRRAAELGLDDRVTFRPCRVEDLDDDSAFDLAWIPAPFLPQPALLAAIPIVHRALRPGGWLLVGMGRAAGREVSAAVTRWQTALIGGTPLTPDEAEKPLASAGFGDFVTLPTPPGAPTVVAARRAPL